MPAGIPLDHFHRWGCDGKRLLHGISIDCNKKVSGFARGSSAVPLGEGKASSPSQSNPSDLPAPPKGGASDASARLAFYLETAPLLQKAPPSGELANECEPERVFFPAFTTMVYAILRRAGSYIRQTGTRQPPGRNETKGANLPSFKALGRSSTFWAAAA